VYLISEVVTLTIGTGHKHFKLATKKPRELSKG